ncbi:MAG: RNA 2'-phosphotransferase [Candidatus Helarchaeota archaeon]
MSKEAINKKTKIRVSKYMSYLLRHNPKQLELDNEGFTDLDLFLEVVRSKFKWLDKKDLLDIAENNERYEIKNNKIKAIYGHSIDVSYKLKKEEVNQLYHGTTKKAAELILKEGLKPMNRQKVHLSSTIEAATRVGKRRAKNPTILIIDAVSARLHGIKIKKASESVFLADYIPPKYIKVLKKSFIS